MKTISFLNHTSLVNGVQISGFADGDGVVAMEFAEGITTTVGADGVMTVNISANRSVKVMLSLAATSSGNSFLTKLWNAQRGGPKTFIPVEYAMKDSYRADAITGWHGAITKPPKVARGEKADKMEWEMTFETGSLDLGDPAFSGLATAVAEAAGFGR